MLEPTEDKLPDPITDFTPIIDPEIAEFVNTSNRIRGAYGPEPTLEQMRRGFDETCAHFHAGYPAGITVSDSITAGIPTRTYTTNASGPVILYLHGGGFVFGGLDSHDDICADIAAATGLTVIAPDYTLSPEARTRRPSPNALPYSIHSPALSSPQATAPELPSPPP